MSRLLHPAILCLFVKFMLCNGTKITAVALFYTDSKGRILLINDELPEIAAETIKRNVKSRLHNLPRNLADVVEIEVKPVFKNANEVPLKLNILKLLKEKFPDVYEADISQAESIKIVNDMRKSNNDLKSYLILSQKDQNSDNMTDGVNSYANNITDSVDSYASNTTDSVDSYARNITDSVDSYATNITDSVDSFASNITDSVDSYASNITDSVDTYKIIMTNSFDSYGRQGTPPNTTDAANPKNKSSNKNDRNKKPLTKEDMIELDKIIPNDIYYGIEKKCANWNEACHLKANNFVLPASWINVPSQYVIQPVKNLDWIRIRRLNKPIVCC